MSTCSRSTSLECLLARKLCSLSFRVSDRILRHRSPLHQALQMSTLPFVKRCPLANLSTVFSNSTPWMSASRSLNVSFQFRMVFLQKIGDVAGCSKLTFLFGNRRRSVIIGQTFYLFYYVNASAMHFFNWVFLVTRTSPSNSEVLVQHGLLGNTIWYSENKLAGFGARFVLRF